MDRLRIGTRGSALALWQANHVADLLKAAHPGLAVDVEVVKTTGDKVTDVSLSQIGGKGLFTVELERALAQGQVDICVHSMKDVQTVVPEGLAIVASPKRADVRDVLVSHDGSTFRKLPRSSRVGTGSLRRMAQLRALRDDLEYVDLRGNLDTRIRKATSGELDAVVLAGAGIDRMGWSERISMRFPTDEMLPAVGQGAIGIEARLADDATLALLGAINDPDTLRCVTAERAVMRALEGGCQAPLGAYAALEDGVLSMDAMVASIDGTQVLRERAEGSSDGEQDARMVEALVETMSRRGAREILDAARFATEAKARERLAGHGKAQA